MAKVGDYPQLSTPPASTIQLVSWYENGVKLASLEKLAAAPGAFVQQSDIAAAIAAQGLGSASTHEASDFATPANIIALNLQSASQHPASDFATPSSTSAAINELGVHIACSALSPVPATTFIAGLVATFAFHFPTGLTGSFAKSFSLAQTGVFFNLRKNGAAFGSLSYSAGVDAGVFVCNSVVSFAVGDYLTIQTSTGTDAQWTGFFTLVGSRT